MWDSLELIAKPLEAKCLLRNLSTDSVAEPKKHTGELDDPGEQIRHTGTIEHKPNMCINKGLCTIF